MSGSSRARSRKLDAASESVLLAFPVCSSKQCARGGDRASSVVLDAGPHQCGAMGWGWYLPSAQGSAGGGGENIHCVPGLQLALLWLWGCCGEAVGMSDPS